MKPGPFDLDMYRGDTYAWKFKVWNDTEKTVPADLTGVTPFAQIRETTESPTATNLTCTLTLPNTIDVGFPVASWDAFTLMKAVWDLQLTYASGVVATIVAGKVTVTADVTKVMP
jgi:hypothetical protein